MAGTKNGAQRVMVVDDDGVCRAMISRGLRQRGFNVCSYGDPRQAVDRLEVDLPAAVITDMRMPHLSGLDVVRSVRERLGTGLPVLVVSASDEETYLAEAFRAGASDYLLKPINDTELGVKLERALKPKGGNDHPTAVPDRIGEWQLIDCIGRGGTACVFTAVRDGEERVQALKVLWPHLTSSTETLLRFRREIDVLSELSHPRLVGFVASGRHEHFYYYVMDYFPGGTLRSRLERLGRGDAQLALRVVEELCEPLGYLHERGLIHRDVKPGNIFFDAHDGAVLGDFGLARRVLDRGITLEEEFIGTPLYLAPEVFRSAEFDQSVDFYALGVCAFELLLGRRPAAESDTVQLIGQLIDDGLPRPEDLLTDQPEPVVNLLERLLAPPDERLASAAEVVAAVAETRAALG